VLGQRLSPLRHPAGEGMAWKETAAPHYLLGLFYLRQYCLNGIHNNSMAYDFTSFDPNAPYRC